MELVLISVLLFGLPTGFVTRAKGRGYWLGFWVGSLLSAIGLIICLFLPGDPAGKAKRLIAKGEHKRCVGCANAILIAATVCQHCGTHQAQFGKVA